MGKDGFIVPIPIGLKVAFQVEKGIVKKRSFFRKAFHRFYIRHWPGFNPFKLAEWDVIDRYLKVEAGMRVLDIACGGGYFTRRVCEKGAEMVVGVDLSTDGVSEAQQNNRNRGMHYAISDAMQLPLQNNSFDAVVSVCAFEHFADDTAALKEVFRVLKPGGSFVLTVDSLSYSGISPEFLEACCKAHYVERCYTKVSFHKSLREAGFEVDVMEYIFNSPGSSFSFKLFTHLYWRGIDLLDPFLYPVLRPLSLFSDRFFSRQDEGYAIVASARKPLDRNETEQVKGGSTE